MSKKYALVIGNSEYIDPGLSQLAAPGKDAQEFARVLKDQDICAFDDVLILTNEPAHVVREKIDEFFDQRKSDDLLVLYFSGHGIRDEQGALYLAVQNTNRARLRSTAIKSDFVREAMDQSNCKRQVLILDCCNSGAFAHGTKSADNSMGTASAFKGNSFGRVVLTASDAAQYAWEGDRFIGETENSLFTHYLVKGLEGAADRNKDGDITVDDLYEYAYEQIVAQTPKQTPSKWSYRQQGEIHLRQVSEEKKARLRQAQLTEKARQEREEAERLARLQVERDSVTRYAEQLNAQKTAAEVAAREAEEKLLQEKARYESIRNEIARQQAQQTDLASQAIPAPGIPRQGPKKLSAAAYAALGTGIIVLAVMAVWGISKLAARPGASQPAASSTRQPVETGGTDQLQETDPPMTPVALDFSQAAAPLTLENTSLPQGLAPIGLETAPHVLQLARWGKGAMTQAFYSPDGKNILVAATVGVYFLDAANLKIERFIDTGNYVIVGASLSTDGTTLFVITQGGDILRFRTSDGTFISGTKGFLSYVRTPDISTATNRVALTGYSSRDFGVVYLIDLDSGEITQRLELDTNTTPSINSVHFSPDGKYLFSVTGMGIYMWDVEKRELLTTLEPQESFYGYTDIVFSPDGKTFAYIASDNSIKLLDMQTRQVLQEFEGHDVGVWGLAFSPDGQSVYYGVGETGLRIRDIDTGELTGTLPTGSQNINEITFSPDGSSFITLSGEYALSIWDTASGTSMATSQEFGDSIRQIVISPDNQSIFSISETAVLWNFRDGSILQSLPQSSYYNSHAVFSKTENLLITKLSNDSLVFWENDGGRLVKMKQTEVYAFDFFDLSPDGQYLAAYQSDRLEIFKVSEVLASEYSPPALAQIPLSSENGIKDLSFSPGSDLLAAAAQDGSIMVWNTLDGVAKYELKGHAEEASGVAFAPDGRRLASTSDDGTIILWDLDTGALLRTLEFPKGDSPVKAAFSPDGQVIAVGSHDGPVALFNANDGSVLTTLAGHVDQVTSLAFTTDGLFLVTSSRDGTIRIWGVPR